MCLSDSIVLRVQLANDLQNASESNYDIAFLANDSLLLPQYNLSQLDQSPVRIKTKLFHMLKA